VSATTTSRKSITCDSRKFATEPLQFLGVVEKNGAVKLRAKAFSR
jgi:hypothetical protein